MSDWNRDMAAHLARRAGFGARPAELDELVALGRAGAVSRFVDLSPEDEALEREIREVGGTLTDLGDGEGADIGTVAERARGWWFYRMVRGSQPLREKLVLLWHDLFACQRSKIIRLPQYLGQNEVFRAHADGSFRELLFAVARDAGMLTYLDNRLSDARNPNENWGRELLELFTLGVDNGYEQRDVYELARVFTGWTTPNENSAEFVYDPAMHDEGDKVLFGERIAGRGGEAGVQEGYEAMERILARPECAGFVAGRLVGWFLGHDPDPLVVARAAQRLRDTDWSIRETLRDLFESDRFYAASERGARFKNPVELVVSAGRLLELQNPHLAELDRHARALGMDLFEPPSVAGWDHGAAWVNSNSTVARSQFALRTSALPTSPLPITGTAVLDLDAIAGGAESDAELVANVSQRLLQEVLPEHAAVEAYLAAQPLSAQWSAERARREKTRAVIHLLLLSPRFALA